MLDRLQKKEIIQSLSEINRLYTKTSSSPMDKFNIILQILDEVDRVCKESIPASRYAFYGDLFGVIRDSINKLSDSRIPLADSSEIKRLFSEIMGCCISSFKQEKVKKEIVFLPYKASMWDCMETVWKAAYEDKDNCNVYVVPIPYCDRNLDLSCGKIHCEKNLFPSYVPVLDWSKFNLKQVKPDVVVIHNPYDDSNLVTSVEERFYSRNLKKYAKKLVYIPYYLSNNIVSADKCVKPGVLNADIVILENENIKRQYEIYYPEKNIPKNKFLALGSPQIEKLLSTSIDDVELPNAWKKLIAGRKVVLYNTSVGAMLKEPSMVCKKLEIVFDKFRKNQDLALWWRPHPLMKQTIRSMNPKIYDKYCQIEKKYIEAGWGIYDDTPNMDRAIICGDCYYGDDSGVMWTYEATGKPIIIQEMSYIIQKQKFDIPIWSQAYCRVGDELWFVHGKLNILLKYNIVNRRLHYVAKLAGSLFGGFKYCALQYANGSLYCIPIMADNILRYDISHDKIVVMSFPMDQQYAGMAKFRKVLAIKDKIYMFPTFYPYILCINTENNTVECKLDVKKILLENNIPQASYIHDVAVYEQNVLMCLLYQTNKILLLDVENNNYEIITLGKHKYMSIAIVDDSIFLGSDVEHCVDCFNIDDFAYRRTIIDSLCVVSKIDAHHVLLDNIDELGWIVIDSDCNIIYRKNDVKIESGDCLTDIYKRVICDGDSTSWDTCSSVLYLWDRGKAIKLNMLDINNLDEEIFANQQVQYEYPGLDMVKLCYTTKPQAGKTQIGKKIYKAIVGI